VDHVIAINDARCRLIAASSAHGLEVEEWRDQAELAWMAQTVGAVPDGYFVLRRRSAAGSVVAAFFLEVERSPRSARTMAEKYRRLLAFHASGLYEERFRKRSLRMLVVTAAMSEDVEARWATRLCATAERIGLGFGLFASFRQLMHQPGDRLLEAPIWLRSVGADPCAIGVLAAPWQER